MTTLTEDDLSHHALIVLGNEATEAVSLLENLLEVSFSHAAHEDIVYRIYESLGINEVRELAFLSLKKPVHGGLLRLIVVSNTLTTEAQHALLKQTEEPNELTRYIFLLPARTPLLATLRSRCAVVSLSKSNEGDTSTATTILDDLKNITKITKDKNDVAMEVRLGAVEALLHGTDGKDTTHNTKEHDTALAHALLLARSYIESRGSSPKMLLEHVALTHHEAKLQ